MFKQTKRGDRKILADFTLKDAYKKYKDVAIKELQVDFKTYKKVCKEFNKEVFTNIIEDNIPFKVPCRLGTLRVRKSKMNYKDKNKLGDKMKQKDFDRLMQNYKKKHESVILNFTINLYIVATFVCVCFLVIKVL